MRSICSSWLTLVVVEQRAARRLRVADKTDAARAGLGDLRAANGDAAVVVIDENGVAADLVDEAVFQRAILRAVEEDRAAAINRPVRAQQRLFRVHDRARRLAESIRVPRSCDPAHRMLRRHVAAKFDQRAQARGFDDGVVQIEPGGRIKIERVRFGIQKPFARRVQFLENIFHETDLLGAPPRRDCSASRLRALLGRWCLCR